MHSAPELRYDWPVGEGFNFYGHHHDWLSISPNGFLTTHPVTCEFGFCNWWGEENGYRRYMAPLMADFDPSAADDALIYWRYDSEEKSISVQWHNIPLWKDPLDDDLPDDRWDFQIKVKEDGTIFFYYFDVPVLPSEVPIANTPGHEFYAQLVGLEDAAYQHDDGGYYKIKALEKVEVASDALRNKYIVMFQPKETCIGMCLCCEITMLLFHEHSISVIMFKSDQSTCDDCKAINARDADDDLQCGWCEHLYFH